jgi:hypothetical protein
MPLPPRQMLLQSHCSLAMNRTRTYYMIPMSQVIDTDNPSPLALHYTQLNM